MPVWPSEVPFFLSPSGNRKTSGSNIIMSQTDIGNPKRRRRSTIKSIDFQGTIPLMTREQMDVFRAFYNDDLVDGLLRFDYTDPYENVPRQYFFIDGFEEVQVGGKFTVSADLRVL